MDMEAVQTARANFFPGRRCESADVEGNQNPRLDDLNTLTAMGFTWANRPGSVQPNGALTTRRVHPLQSPWQEWKSAEALEEHVRRRPKPETWQSQGTWRGSKIRLSSSHLCIFQL